MYFLPSKVMSVTKQRRTSTFHAFSLLHLHLAESGRAAAACTVHKAEILKGLLWTVGLHCFPTSSPFVICVAFTTFVSSLLRSQGRFCYSLSLTRAAEPLQQREVIPPSADDCIKCLVWTFIKRHYDGILFHSLCQTQSWAPLLLL